MEAGAGRDRTQSVGGVEPESWIFPYSPICDIAGIQPSRQGDRDGVDGPLRHVGAGNGSAAARLLRAYATQVEALRLRNGGSQTVRVEHVHVNEGGQAVIGNVKSNPGSGQ